MKTRFFTGLALGAGVVLIAIGALPDRDQAPRQDTNRAVEVRGKGTAVAFSGVRIFDGENVIPRANLLVEDGRIADFGPELSLPTGIPIEKGEGRTLLPGLIDAHTHVFGDALQRALSFGVTTEIDMFSDTREAARLRSEQRNGLAPFRADVVSAGTLVTAPKGHGTEYFPIPTLSKAEDAPAFVAARLGEGSEFIKLIFDNGAAHGLKWPTLDPATLDAVVRAAHGAGVLAVAHTGSRAEAVRALEAGVDGLVHIFADAPPGDFAHVAAARDAFVIPTLTVMESLAGHPRGSSLLEDPGIGPLLDARERQALHHAFPEERNRRIDRAYALQAVRRLAAAGVPILAGTDAPNPGTVHGASLHRELDLLVESGLTPIEALKAATSVPARAFRLDDRGCIRTGLRADLLLVEGDPTTNIKATRRIVRVFKQGIAHTPAPPPASGVAPKAPGGLVSDFDGEGFQSSFGSGWTPSTDEIMGGRSAVRLDRVTPGAGSQGGALRISGTVASGAPFPWAGALFSPGARPMAAVDLSATPRLRFRARGQGRLCRVIVFSTQLGQIPASREFLAAADWQEFAFPLSSFSGLDGSDVSGVLFAAGSDEGDFAFEIDDVAFLGP